MDVEAAGLSPVGWVREHVEQYEATGGEVGHHLQGRTTAVLTVTGRRTGKRHRTGVTYWLINGEYVVVDSNGGSPDRPQWSRNMEQSPGVGLQVGAAPLSGTPERHRARRCRGGTEARVGRTPAAGPCLRRDAKQHDAAVRDFRDRR